MLLATAMLMGWAGEALADTDKLTAAYGWAKVTAIPTATDIASNYYVFVDNDNDLMLGIAKGVNQNTKWYSLGVYYQAAVESTTSGILSKTWTLEVQGNGFALRNLEYSVSPMQTEWNAAWKYDTNDIYEQPNDWAKVLLAYADGHWTIQNGYYPDAGFLGPWVDSNFADGAECAANKTGSNVGKFQIYAIARDRYRQNLLDVASANNPVDLTPFYVTNATFDRNNRNGWNETGSGGNSNTSLGCEIWHRSNFDIHQDVTVPKGKYTISIQAAGSTTGTVYGTSGANTVTANTTAATDGNFQNTVLRMIQDRSYGKITTPELTVDNGTLTIGFKDASTDQWDVFDNFKIYCTGVDLQAYIDQLAEAVAQANAFVDSDVAPAAVKAIVEEAVATYDKTYETAKAYSDATLALLAIVNQYKNDTGLQQAYADYKAMRDKMTALADKSNYDYTDDSGAKAAFDAAAATANSAVEAATTADAIAAQTNGIRTAGLTFISNVRTEDGNPFDITFLASQAYADWKKKDGSPAGIVQDQFLTGRPADLPPFAESYETTCATTGTVLYQTVADLPEGYYQVGMYAQALFTTGRGFDSEATEGDANRSFAFAGDQRTGLPIKFGTSVPFDDLTTLDVNVHLDGGGDLTFGVQKDANGSNWHFAQIASIRYSNAPDLTQLEATRDNLVAEAMGILNGVDANFLSSEQQQALQQAIDEGNAANSFETLNTVTLNTLPNAIQTARQLIAQAKANRVEMVAALERFERDYNLVDGTDYGRNTMSAKAWTDLLDKVNAVGLALDDPAQASNYATLADALNAQMDATDASILLFKRYKAMADGTTAIGIFTETTAMTDTDEAEMAAIAEMNSAFTTYAATQAADFDASAFLGENLDFNTPQGDQLTTVDVHKVFDIVGWEEEYANLDANCFIENSDAAYSDMLYLRSNWTAQPVELRVGKQKMLPVGKYKLSLKWNGNLQNMTNLSQFLLGSTATAIGKATTTLETLEYEFEVTGEATPFDITIGLRKLNSGNTPAQILVDDITLTCIVNSEFQIALDAARSVEHAATASAVAQFEAYEGHEDDFESSDARRTAIAILRNAKTIADNGGNATGIIANADFTGGAATGTVQGSGGQVRYPDGWQFDYSYEGWHDTNVADGVFNAWAGNIHLAELSQAVACLPNGAYRLTAEVKTDIEAAASQLALYGLDADKVGRSGEAGSDIAGSTDAFATYSCAFDVAGNAATIGIRSDKAYYQLKNVQLEYIGATAEEETAASYLRQHYFWNGRTSLWYDATDAAYAAAKGVVVYPQEPNQLIVAAASDQFADATNKIVDGVCAQFVLTDRHPLAVVTPFTATSATYTRTLAQDDAAYTVFLPYALSSNDNVQFYTLASSRTDGLHFNEVEATTPMTPYLAMAAADASLNATDVEVVATDASHDVTADGYTMRGSLTGMGRDEAIAEHAYIMQSDNEWKPVGNSSPERPIPTFRAYIIAPADAGSSLASWFDGLSAIQQLALPTLSPAGAVYDVQGRKVADSAERLAKGVYIINRKKYVVK